MKRIVSHLILAAGLLGLLAVPAAAQDGQGARVYNDNCNRCHQPRAPREFSDAAWEVIIHHMHVRGYLTEQERVAVLRYLQANNRRAAYVPEAPAPPAEAGADGEALVQQYGCRGCHVVEGEGGDIGPSLDTVFQRRDAEYIQQKLSDPTFDNPRSVMPFFNLSEAQKEALVEYLREVQGG